MSSMKRQIQNVRICFTGDNVLFKIDPNTGEIKQKDAKKGKVVFCHNDFSHLLQRDKFYSLTGSITIDTTKTYELFISDQNGIKEITQNEYEQAKKLKSNYLSSEMI